MLYKTVWPRGQNMLNGKIKKDQFTSLNGTCALIDINALEEPGCYQDRLNRAHGAFFTRRVNVGPCRDSLPC